MNRNARPMTIDEIRSSEKVAQTAREAAEKQIKQENWLFQEEIRKKTGKGIKRISQKTGKTFNAVVREKRNKAQQRHEHPIHSRKWHCDHNLELYKVTLS